MSIGADDYREASLIRLNEAILLYEREQWVGCVYLAGRAVQCVLRSMLWSPSGDMHTGHNLPQTLDAIRRTGLIRAKELDRFVDEVADLSIVWRNDLRFTGPRRFARLLAQSGRDRVIGSMKVKGDPAKANAKHAREIAERIVMRGEPICRKRYSES